MKLRSTRMGRFRLHANRTAPLFSILILLGGAALLDNPAREDAQLIAHRAMIADEMQDFPYQLGMWVGQDVPIPTSAVETLNPHSLVGRRFTRLETSEEVVLALIHCDDLRDMMGHHPPVCYPATGWTEKPDSMEVIETFLADTPVQMRLYRFERIGSVGLEQEQCVLSMFFLPDGLLLTDMQELKGRSSSGRSLSATGVAQLQMVFAASPETTKIVEQSTELLGAVPPGLMKALTARIHSDAPEQSPESESNE